MNMALLNILFRHLCNIRDEHPGNSSQSNESLLAHKHVRHQVEMHCSDGSTGEKTQPNLAYWLGSEYEEVPQSLLH